MHLLGSALLEGNPDHFQSRARRSDWLWDCAFDLCRLAGPLEISCETLHPSTFRIKVWISIKAPRLYLSALTLVMARETIWSQIKPLLKSMAKLFSSMFSLQGTMCSELEDEDQGQKLLSMKRGEKGNQRKRGVVLGGVLNNSIQLCNHWFCV